jgi:hypothetical protein
MKTTSKELRGRFVQMKKDAVESIIRQLGDSNSIDININLNNGDKFAKKIYREDGRIYVDVNELDLYDKCEIVRTRYFIERLSIFELIDHS